MNTDKLQTILGLARAIVVSATTYVITTDQSSPIKDWSYKNTVLYAGLVYSVIDAVKSYYAAGVTK